MGTADSGQTVVHFFSDIEGSTRLWEAYPDAMRSVIQRHDQLVDGLIEDHGGRVVDHAGDGVFAVFEDGSPLSCAVEIQHAIQSEPWDEIGELRVRMGLHAGKVDVDRSDDRGPLANRTARIMDAAHGGQIVVTPDVLDHYRVPEDAKVADLGSHRLKDLSDPQPIYGLTHPQLSLQEFPELRSLSAHPHNLPTQTTPFVGRADELATISCHLTGTDHRLLTLLGPGGTGKTRLSIQAAAEQFETFPDGVFFVPLASVQTVESAISAVADAIGFTFYSNEEPRTQLINYLEGKSLLIVMDNCEHLDGVNRLISELLGAAPDLTVLATSRTRLNLKGEVVLDLEGLEVPESPSVNDVDDYSGLRLFVDSAQRARADFTVDEDNLSHIVRVCRLLNGMPLGIELAAAWVRMLPVEEIIEEIETSLDFLESAYEDLPERQRSLRAVFDYSWQLLSEEEQTAFAKLSVFRGAFDRKAAKQVAGVSMMALAALVDKSLLHADDEGRYSIHNLLRQYAEEQLAQDPEQHREALQSHGDHFAERLAAWEPELMGEGQIEGLDAIQAMFDDVRFMWHTALERGQWDWANKSIEGLYLFCERRSRLLEGQRLFEAALEAVETAEVDEFERSSLKSRFQARLGSFLNKLGQPRMAEPLLREAHSSADERDDPAEAAFALIELGYSLRGRDPQTAQSVYEESRTLSQNAGDRRSEAIALCELGQLDRSQGELHAARAKLEESLRISQQQPDQAVTAGALNDLGAVADELGDYATAQGYLEQSWQVYDKLGSVREKARNLNAMASIEFKKGYLDEAAEKFLRSLDLYEELGDKGSIAICKSNLATVKKEQQAYRQAEELYQESLQLIREIGHRRQEASNLINQSALAYDQGHYDKASSLAEECLTIARELQDKRLIGVGLIIAGTTALKRQQIQSARESLNEAVNLLYELGDPHRLAYCLIGLISLHCTEGERRQAARLQGVVTRLIEESELALDPQNQAEFERTEALLTDELGDDAYSSAFEEGQTIPLDQLLTAYE